MSNCTRCGGTGKITETKTEQDVTMSIVMGSALDMGYFPMTKTTTERVNCPRCGGSGDAK